MELEPLAVGVKQAAGMIGLSHFTVREKVRKGEIEAIRIGRRIVIRVDELRDFLQRHRRPGA